MAPPVEWFPQTFHAVYDGINPSKFTGINQGKVVFITGASKGLGLASAKAFASTGASLFIAARSEDGLKKAKAEIEASQKVPVAYAVVDVGNEESVKAGVAKAVEVYGKIDIVIANAGNNMHDGAIGTPENKGWWNTQEVNVNGSYLLASYTLPELRKTKGYIVFMSSSLAQLRLPSGSAYNIAKLSLIRLAEWVDAENKGEVKAIAMHPGAVATDLSAALIAKDPFFAKVFTDPPELGVWTQVRLTSGSEDYLSGRFVDATWGLDEVAKQKERIIADDMLKIRLDVPQLA